MKKKNNSIIKSVFLGLMIIFAVVFYAYGFQVTKIDLEETKSEKRQTQLFRIIRALAQPNLLDYELKEFNYEVSFMIPCPDGGFSVDNENNEDPYIVANPNCAEEGEKVTISGSNFPHNIKGQLYFIPPSNVTLSLSEIETDGNGTFSSEVTLPERSDREIQKIRLVIKEKVSGPYLSQNAKDTWDKIVETVFLALLATTFGILIAIPLSFFAARNLMEDLTNTLVGVALTIISTPIGIILGNKLGEIIQLITNTIPDNMLVYLMLGAISFGLLLLISKYAIPQQEDESVVQQDFSVKLLRIIGLIGIGILSIFLIQSVSRVFISLGELIVENVPVISFIGVFIGDIGGIVELLLSVIVAVAGGAVFLNIFNKLAKIIVDHKNKGLTKIIQIILGALAGAVLFAILGYAIDWLYSIEDLRITLFIPSLVGAGLGLVLGIITDTKRQLPLGMVVFNLTRGIFNSLRSIDAVIMVIVFVVWVGIGPFAGVLALSLHTVAALAKLYSEQIESIMEGPLEAIRATGANRLQAIIYGVVPQIIPPYISFTLYRWDINVRMSTIIGLGGGGGIGFLLIQNINLLNYRNASAQMIAIAVVVSLMDSISSRLRDRIT